MAKSERKSPMKLVLLAVVAIVVLLAALFVRVYVAPSESMSPTLPEGSRFVALATYGMPCSTGDVVVYEEDGTTYVRRVVACGGDSVKIEDGKLFVNSEERELEGVDAREGSWELASDEYLVLAENPSGSDEPGGIIKASQVSARLLTKI